MKNQIKYILFLLVGLVFSQGNFQILTIPSNTRMLSLSNAGYAMNNLVNSYDIGLFTAKENININLHSHLYPAGIFYLNTEIIIPFQKYSVLFSYANLNYGDFKDGELNYEFNSSEFLFKGAIKTQVLNKFSIGTSFNYAINKISNQFSHALLMSLGARTQLENPRLGFGISINNIGKIMDVLYHINEDIPASLNLSTFYSPQYFPGILLLDISKFYNASGLQIRTGIEITINDYLLLRFGNSSNSFNLSDPYSSYFPGLSSGIGIKSKKWDIDIGFFNLETAGIVTGLSLLYKK